MLENGSKIKLDETFLRKKRSDAKSASLFKGFKNLYFLIGIITGFIILCLMFFLSSYSNIYHISVKGNYYLTDSDVIRLSGLSEDNKYFFTSTHMGEKRMLKSPYFDSVKVKKLDDQVVEIEVSEKKQIAYTTIGSYQEIIFVDGTSVELVSNPVLELLINPVVTIPKSVEEIVVTELNPVLEFLTNPVEVSPKLVDEIVSTKSKEFNFETMNPEPDNPRSVTVIVLAVKSVVVALTMPPELRPKSVGANDKIVSNPVVVALTSPGLVKLMSLESIAFVENWLPFVYINPGSLTVSKSPGLILDTLNVDPSVFTIPDFVRPKSVATIVLSV